MSDYRAIYRTEDGHLRVPFASLGIFLRIEGIRVSVAEARAIENVSTFVFSGGILCRRLKRYIDGYREDSWVDVPIQELFLDTQAFFLFIKQFLEDLALIIRMSLPAAQRPQMPAAFSHLIPRLLKILPEDAPLFRFFAAEQTWFDEINDLRDDILHRTAFGRKRAATFPDLIEVLRAGAGQTQFVRGADLRSYVGGVLVRIFSLTCLADQFVQSGIAARHPNAQIPMNGGILLRESEIELSVDEKVSRFGLGTIMAQMGQKSCDALEFFIQAGEDGRSTAII